MQNTNTFKVLITSLCAIGSLACGLGSIGQVGTQESPTPLQEALPTPQENPTPTQAPEEVTVTEVGCTNRYIPVVLNTRWTYQSTGSPRGEHTLTETISDVRADGFTVTTDYGSATKMVDWSCMPDGLRVFGSGNNPAQGLSVGSDQWQLDVSIKSASGVTLLAKANPGDSWTERYEFESTGELAGSTVVSSGVATSSYEFLGEESITTPAGTFQAIKIRSSTKEDIQTTTGGSAVNSSNEYQTILWFVEGIGRVKSETTGSYTETIELQSYSIP